MKELTEAAQKSLKQSLRVRNDRSNLVASIQNQKALRIACDDRITLKTTSWG